MCNTNIGYIKQGYVMMTAYFSGQTEYPFWHVMLETDLSEEHKPIFIDYDNLKIYG